MSDEEARAALRRKTDRTLSDLEKFLGVPARRLKMQLSKEVKENSKPDKSVV